ncbi:MAG: M28 family peptidase [Vicinamibacteria bacterium]
MTRSAALLALFLLAGCGTPPPAEPPPPPPGPAEDEIAVGAVTAHVRLLSHDLLEGRGPATRGGDLAAEYIATQLAVMGVEPAGDEGTYFQQVPIIESQVDRNFTLSVPGASYRYLQDVVAFAGVENPRVHVQGDVVFVGHGIVAPEQNWDDYAGVDVKGKWVLVMVNDPPATDAEPDLFAGKALTYYGRWTYKYEEAARQGAAGAILIHTDESATYPWQVVQSSWSGAQYSVPPPEGAPALQIKAWMTDAAASDLVKRAGRDLNALRNAALQRGFKPVSLGMRAAATLTQRTSRRQSPNVIGKVRGVNDQQAVVFTSHYDHFGVRAAGPGAPADADTIYNGAYDNASGVAGTLMIAQAMARAAEPPARSMYFVFTAAEESGLLGAEYWASRPSLPMDNVVANLNIDGLNYLGPTRDLTLLGADRSSLGPMAEALAAERGRTLSPDQYPERGYFFRSDHFPLAKAGVPALSISEPREFLGPNAAALREKQQAYNTTHYHQPSDEYDPSWDFSGGVEDLRFLAQLAWRIAALETPPAYNEGDQFAAPRRR